MNTYMIRRRSAWADAKELEAAGGKSGHVESEMKDRLLWVRSYIFEEPDGRLGSVCIYQAKDVPTVQEHAKRAGMPADEVLPVTDVIVRVEDPALSPKH